MSIEPPHVFQIWQGQHSPYAKENSIEEYEQFEGDTVITHNVVNPTLAVYPAEGKNTGIAVILFPGGSYRVLATYKEGYDVAQILAKQGITAAVLKYRLPNTEASDRPHLAALADARRAMQLLRENAAI